MIRVTIKIWPGGCEARAGEVARMNIGNVSDLAAVSDYEIWASSDAHATWPSPSSWSRAPTNDPD